ncbi:hypothetical protein ABFV05_003385 [Capra hircus]
MDKQHVCVVKHQKNIGGTDQEIIFPSIKEVVSSVVTTTEPPTTEPPTTEPPTTEPPNDCLTDESSALQLQLTTTSAYYTYLLLLLLSAVYFVVIISCRKRLDYCRSIYHCDSSGWKKIFGEGANIIVTPPERNLAADTSPKPTVFLPSIAEINHDNAGTYLCLLENFFPDVITVSWRVKNDKRALPSQQGNTMKTKDTYMKLSWLTVTENSMDKQHVCVVKHQKNIGGIDQEIIFPSIKEVVSSAVTTTEPPTTEPPTTEPPNDCLTDESKVTGTGSKKACLKDESEVTGDTNSTKARLEGENSALQLQLTTTSAYYTYLLLLLRSAVYFVVIISCVFRRTGVCCDWKI